MSEAQEGDAAIRAERLNSEGKALIGELDLEGAAAKFREAIGLIEDPRYAFNLCYTLEKSGGLEEAERACTWVTGSTNKRLAKKAVELLKRVKAKLASRPGTSASPSPVVRGVDSSGGEPPQSVPAPVTSTPGTSATGENRPPPPVRTYPIRTSLPASPVSTNGIPTAQPVKTTRWGVRGGTSLSTVNGLGSNDGQFLSGMLGVMYTRSFGAPFQLIYEAQFAGRGAQLVTGDLIAGRGAVDLDLTYLDLSSTSRYSFGNGTLRPFLELGSSLSFLLLSKISTDFETSEETSFPTLDVSFNVGGGITFGSLEVRVVYMRGLLDLSSDLQAGSDVYSVSTLFEGGYWF
ncbi:MAG: outer membrane beta-barrel protein [Kofleriaceae bacterium]|nr:outer membrane beta-barrel protein [Kofleriaceae bacterium]